LVAFQSGARKNSVQMHDLAGRMTAQQIKAVADYIAGLR
ncbi:cytochrome c4, partial [Escherichia coli]|nr:cytochrome c4 [Escherichia coli]